MHIRNTRWGIDRMTTRVCFQSLFRIISWKCQSKWYKGDPRLCSLCILYALNTAVDWHYREGKMCIMCPGISGAECVWSVLGQKVCGLIKRLDATHSGLREDSHDCATLLPMIEGTDCRKHDEKHKNHVLYKLRNRKIIPFYWENIQLQTWSIQYQIILWHYFSVTCCSGLFSLGCN